MLLRDEVLFSREVLNMKKLSMIALIFVLLLTGCSSGNNGDDKEIKRMSDTNNKDVIDMNTDTVTGTDAKAEFFELVKNSEAGDGKGINWDGNKASVIDDEMNSFDIDDGGYVSENPPKYREEMLIEFRYPEGFKQVDVNPDELDNCHFTDGDDEIIVKQINYEEMAAAIENSDDYKQTDSVHIQDYRSKYFDKYMLYVGLKDFDGITKAGYTLIFKSALDDRSYIVEVYGLGNINSIKAEAALVMNSIDVLWY